MSRHTYEIAVDGRLLKEFEFIVGPMSAVSIPQPPRRPEDFILAAFEGGATPIAGSRDVDVDVYIRDIVAIKRGMGERVFGANMFGTWSGASDFIKKFNELGDDSPQFLDVNAIELNFREHLPLLRDVRVPIYMGVSQPISLYALKKHLLAPAYSFLRERIESGTLKLTLPRNVGGGHLPILLRDQEKLDWLDLLIRAMLEIQDAIRAPIPFIVEKGMMTVNDFVNTITEYSRYPSFAGVRFASNLELTIESGLSHAAKALVAEIVRKQEKHRIVPIRSSIAASKNGLKVRGGLISYAVATKMVKMIHTIQSGNEGFPQYSRIFNPAVLMHQAETTDRRVCHLCNSKCPKEYCEIKGAWDSVAPDGNIDDAIIFVAPRILELDPEYVGSSATFVVRDLIQKTLSRIHHPAST